MSYPQYNTSQLLSRAIALHKTGNLNEAESIYRDILASEPLNANAMRLLGTAHLQRGHNEEGIRLISLSLEIDPRQPTALVNHGNALQELKRYEDALGSYDKAISLKPDFAEAYNDRGNALQELKRYEDALGSYDKAISLKADFTEAYNNRGNVLRAISMYDEALKCYDKATMLKPEFFLAHFNRAITLQQMNRDHEALAGYTQTIALKPDYGPAYYNRGVILHHMKRYNDALANYDAAIALIPPNAVLYNKKGNVLMKIKRFQDALVCYDKAISLNSGYAAAYYNRGMILKRLCRYDDALINYEKAMSINPDFRNLIGELLTTKMHLCDWQGINSLFKVVVNETDAGKPIALPFVMVTSSSLLAPQKKCAEMYVKHSCPPSAISLWNGERYDHNRIRIGYFSADFENHATSHLMAELFEQHDNSKFEITAFSFGPLSDHPMRKRLEKAFDNFIDVSTKSDAEIAALAKRAEIDIAIDLKGFTQNSRPEVFAFRPSPIQVSYLGYPGTMGASYIDYLVADHILIPENHRQYYSEKIVYLPNSYQVNDSSKIISEKHFTRKEMGLPEVGVVFCCFNNTFKITPDVFNLWMRLLNKVDGSVLWLLEGNPTSVINLRSEAAARGISGDRLVFAKRMDLANHLARHRIADLFLDTSPCNAHTTASDSLWAGLPVLTCLGETFAGRVATSLLKAVGLQELVTHSHMEYEALALELATNPQKLSILRHKLAQNRTTCPLFDTKLFTKNFEVGLIDMWKRSQAGLPPDNIFVHSLNNA